MTQALEAGGYKEDAGKIGAGAAVGAIIGGILGGVKGAITGILIGGGGVVAATEGEDVELPEGTVLRMRLDQPVTSPRQLHAAVTTGREGSEGQRGPRRREHEPLFATAVIATRAASTVFSMSRAVCAPEMNHASNCDGGR